MASPDNAPSSSSYRVSTPAPSCPVILNIDYHSRPCSIPLSAGELDMALELRLVDRFLFECPRTSPSDVPFIIADGVACTLVFRFRPPTRSSLETDATTSFMATISIVMVVSIGPMTRERWRRVWPHRPAEVTFTEGFRIFFFSFSAGRVSCRESGSAHRWRCFPSAGREEVTSVDRGARRSATFLSASSVARPCQRLLPFSDWFAFPQKLTSPIPTMPRFESTPSVVAHRLRGSLAHLLFFSFEANQPSIQRNLLFMSAPYSSVVDASSTTTAGSFMAACGFGGVSFSGQCDWRTPGCLDKVGHDHVKMAVRGSRGDSVGSDPLASSRSYFYK